MNEHRITVSTDNRFDIIKLTDRIQSIVDESHISNQDGLLHVSTLHTTAVLSVNEYESRLIEDMIEKFKQMVPPEAGYRHDRHHFASGTQPNTHAHIISAMIRSPVLLTVSAGDIILGTWEEIMMYETDGPNERKIKLLTLS